MSKITQQELKEQKFTEVTNLIIEQLEKGVDGNWSCPWDRMTSVATNAVTGRRLVGISQILCHFRKMEKGYSANRWLTAKAAAKIGGKVIKGEKAVTIFWLRPFIEVEVDGKKKLKSPEGDELRQWMDEDKPVIWSYRFAPYFNVEQIEGLDDKYYLPTGVEQRFGLGEDFSPISEAEAFINNLINNAKDPLKLEHHGNAAFYSPLNDKVVMPEKGLFCGELEYYGTAFHELGHWTGSKERLARTGIVDFDKFGSKKYAFEELIAELTATFIASEMGLEREIRKDHVQYIANWIEVLKEDNMAIFKAAQEAMKAVRYLNGLAVIQSIPVLKKSA